ncbi:MAG: sel1 repeat family protein [Rickettsiales bacterium]|nr:sel1 repeat family protein [Rickettsiales bacterium]
MMRFRQGIIMLAACVATLASPAWAEMSQQQIDSTIQQMEQAALAADDVTFATLRSALESDNTTEAYVALGKLYGNLPTRYILRIKDYEQASAYYRRALALGEERQQESKDVNVARVALSRFILQGRLRDADADEKTAIALLEKAVESGNPNAAYILARHLERRGVGKAPNYKEAEYWYRAALRGQVGEAAIALVSLAKRGYITLPSKQSKQELSALGISLLQQRTDRGDSTAAYRLGRIYALGITAEADLAEAKQWYLRAAKLGSVSALRELSLMASRNDKNATEAAKYMLQAAESGSIVSAVELAKKLARPEGYYLDVSQEVAHLWAERAAAVGNVTAIGILSTQLLAEGKVEQAVSYLERAASKGNMESYLTLYRLFKNAEGVAKDTERAARYFVSALQSRQLVPQEKERLALILLDGSEPVYDETKGLSLLNEAANEGAIDAMSLLADMYLHGKNVAVDVGKALSWLEKASALGDVTSTLTLSLLYEEGVLVKQNRMKANRLITQTLKNVAPDDSQAMMTIGKAYVEGKGVVVDMDEAAKWFKRATEAGSIEGLVTLGRLVKWNAVKAFQASQAVGLFEQAASAGSKSALVELGLLYSIGMLVPLDANSALSYFILAAEGGSLEGMRQAGLAYLGGFGVEKDIEKGTAYLEQAANAGHAGAMLDLGNVYAMRGEDAQAARWWMQASLQKNPDALYFLSQAYREGRGVAKDEKIADQYQKEAAALDSYQALLEIDPVEPPAH